MIDKSLELDLGPPEDDDPLSSREFRVSMPELALEALARHRRPGSVPPPGLPLEPIYPTLTHAFFHALKRGDETGMTLLPERESEAPEHRSWAELAAEAQRLAGRLAARGVGQGDRVLLVLPTGWEFVLSFFALTLLRAPPVPTYPPSMLERAEIALAKNRRIADHAGVKAVITTRKLRLLIGELATVERPLWSTEGLLAEGATAEVPTRAKPSEPAFIQYTSGSTGHPKGVVLTHRALCANIQAIGQALGVGGDDVVVSWLPLYHDMGLIGVLLFAAYWKLPLVIMSPSAFLLNPRRWLKAIGDYRGTLSPAPNFGYARCLKRVRDLEGLDLSSWRVALNGAEPVSWETLRAFEERFAPAGFRDTTFFPVYGLAETSLAATFPPLGRPVKHDRVDREALARGHAIPAEGPGSTVLVGCGAAVPGHRVYVVDAEGRPLPDRQVGHVVVQGPSVMRGYLDAPEATGEVLRGETLWTGDLGYFVEDQLYVAGRVKDLIIVRGRNYHAEDVEAVAERVEGARKGCCVAFGVYDEDQQQDLLVLVCETKLEEEDARAAVAEAIAGRVQEECGLRVDEVVLVPPGTVPKTSSGKRQRTLTRDLFLRDELVVRRTSKLKLAYIFARSGVGFAAARAQRLLRRRPTHR